MVTKPPITLGMANMEGGPLGSSHARLGAEAAIAHINVERGGVHARALELQTRITNGTPESSVGAAHELVALAPLAFLGGADFFAYASLPIYNASGIPVVGGPAFGDAEMTAPNTFKFSGAGAGNWPAMAVYAIEHLGARTLAILHPDNVPGNSTVASFIVPAIEAKCATCVSVSFPPAATDLASYVDRAFAGKPDAIIAIGPAQANRRLLVALQPRRGSTPVFTSTVSFEAETIRAVGEDAVVGLYTVSAFDSWGDHPDALAYRQAIKRHLGREELDELGVSTFSSVMNLYDLISDLDPAEVTPQALIAQLRAARNRRSFMGHPYYGDASCFPGRPAICDGHTRVVHIGPGVTRRFVTDWVDHSALIPPPRQEGMNP